MDEQVALLARDVAGRVEHRAAAAGNRYKSRQKRMVAEPAIRASEGHGAAYGSDSPSDATLDNLPNGRRGTTPVQRRPAEQEYLRR